MGSNLHNIWKPCCALHTRLLEIDGLDGKWESSISMHDTWDMLNHVPFALQQLHKGWNPRIFYPSGLCPVDNRDQVNLVMDTTNPGPTIG
jgi:hypothetical protein